MGSEGLRAWHIIGIGELLFINLVSIIFIIEKKYIWIQILILAKSYKPIFIKMKREVMFLYGIGFNDLDHGKSTKEKE